MRSLLQTEVTASPSSGSPQDGQAVKANGWQAPLYWTEKDGAWSVFTLRGELPLKDLETVPVSQVSYYEADAYAHWAGLPASHGVRMGSCRRRPADRRAIFSTRET